MVTRSRVDMTLCDYLIDITVNDNGDGTVSVSIESDCDNVQEYARRLTAVDVEELTRLDGTAIIRTADEAGLTPTCLVPMAVLNACWLEMGLISKTFAATKPPLSIEFPDDGTY